MSASFETTTDSFGVRVCGWVRPCLVLVGRVCACACARLLTDVHP